MAGEALDHLASHMALASGRRPVSGADPRAWARHLLRASELEVAGEVPLLPGVSARAVGRQLLEEARGSFEGEPGRAVRAARLALGVLPLDAPGEPPLRLAARVHLARALAAAGDLEAAGGWLDEAVEAITDLRSPAWRADLHGLAAGLRRAQGRSPEALLHLRLAGSACRVLRDDGRLGRVYLEMASVFRAAGELSRAIATARDAVGVSESAGDGSLRVCARHNLAAYLLDAGRVEEAREALGAVLHLYPSSPDSPALLRYRWLAGRLAAVGGDRGSATAAFAEVRDRFLARGSVREAALVALDLAHLHLEDREEGRCREVLAGIARVLGDRPGTPESREVGRLLALLEESGPTEGLLDRFARVLRSEASRGGPAAA